MFNLPSLPKAKKEASPVAIKHPESGEDLLVDGVPVIVHVYGKASKVHRDYTDAKVKAYSLNKNKNKNDLNMDKIRKDAVEYAAACTDKITGLSKEDITSKEDMSKLYATEEYYWFLEQVSAAIENESNFF